MNNRLREFREAAGLSQSALADRVNTGFQQISKLERADRKMTKQWAERLAPHLGTTWWELLGAPPTGLADAGSSLAPPPGPVTIPPVTEIVPEEEDGFDTLLAAAEAMLTEEGAPMSQREFALLARQLWREVEDLGADVPLPDRITKIIARRRTMLRAARRLAVGPWRPRS